MVKLGQRGEEHHPPAVGLKLFGERSLWRKTFQRRALRNRFLGRSLQRCPKRTQRGRFFLGCLPEERLTRRLCEVLQGHKCHKNCSTGGTVHGLPFTVHGPTREGGAGRADQGERTRGGALTSWWFAFYCQSYSVHDWPSLSSLPLDRHSMNDSIPPRPFSQRIHSLKSDT